MTTIYEFMIGEDTYIFNITSDNDVKSYTIINGLSYITWDDDDDAVFIFGYNFLEYAPIKEIIKDKFGIRVPYN